MPMSLDRVTEFAAHAVLAPMCQITLVGELEYYFAAGYGMWPDLAPEGHAPLSHSLCKFVVSADHPVLSENMLTDDDRRIREHPLAVDYGARAFLAVPLRGGAGEPVGALTVLDTVPRPWTAADLLKINDVAELIGPIPAERPETPLPTTALDTAGLLRSMQEAFIAITSDSVVVGFNHAAEQMLGWAADQVCNRPIEQTLCPEYEDQIMSRMLGEMRFAPSQVRMRRELRLRTRNGDLLTVPASLSMVHGSAGSLLCAFINATEVSSS
ncbi:PAS domain S-box protein [Actinoplanes teichomyceticus]|nr:PAS domain S-box protein [Actinoplanes teichomyceticus]